MTPSEAELALPRFSLSELVANSEYVCFLS